MKLPKKKYYINPEKGTVVAKFTETILPFEVILKDCGLTNLEQGIINDILWGSRDGVKVDSDYTSIAKCQSGDKFTIDDGIDIAGIKCDMKYHDAVAKQCRSALKILSELSDKLLEFEREHHKKVYRIETDLKNHYGWEERTGL